MSIAVRNLKVEYLSAHGNVTALAGIDLDIASGECVAMIGRSGAGKSTLIRVLAGLISPTVGQVEIDGVDAKSVTAENLGVLFQDFGLVPQLSAKQNVLCGALHCYPASSGLVKFRADDVERATRAMETLGVAHRSNVPTKRLSGGEKQRVAAARLLTQNPKTILLDEPISALDVHWTKTVIDEIDAMHGTDVTRVVVLHDLEQVVTWADRAILLQDGDIAFDGDPQEACDLLRSRGDNAPKSDPDNATQSTPTRHPQPSIDDKPGLSRPIFLGVATVAIVALYTWALLGVNFSLSKIFGSYDAGLDFLSRTLPPDFSVTGTIFESIIETIQMALIGTSFAATMALPLALLAARNVSPKPVRAAARVVLNAMRTIPSIIWGLFFVAIVGLGPFPGILALSFYATGYLGKFYYEGIESIDIKPARALATCGASRLQQFRYGIFPQVLPLLTSYTLYMFEYNIRAASILGIVGAGGVGFYLHAYVNNFAYNKAATAIVLLLVVVTVIDELSGRVRARLQD